MIQNINGLQLVCRRTIPSDVESLISIIRDEGVFIDEEIETATSMIYDAISNERTTYQSITCMLGKEVVGYILYGKTPFTKWTYDLYWLAVSKRHHREGIGRRLVSEMEDQIRKNGGMIIRVETSGLPIYEPTRRFYVSLGFHEASKIRDFYWEGNDLYTYVKYL